MKQQPYAIAIVGMGGIYPDAAKTEALWSTILSGRSVASEPPHGRWIQSVDTLYDPEVGKPDHLFSRKACFIVNPPHLSDKDVDLPQDLLSKLDPAFHCLLAAGNEAVADAGGLGHQKKHTGLILGNLALPSESSSALALQTLGRAFEQRVLKDIPFASAFEKNTDPINRYVAGLPAGVLAQALGINGGHFTLDAACASSLYAIKLACDQLTSGKNDVMLAGGLARPDSLYTQMGFSQLRALSPNGTCAPFDQKSNGLVVGEGAGLFVLKRLEDARAAGNRIYGVIRGIGLSNDIGGSLLAPASEGQVRAMSAAYRQAGWAPESVDLIECHATGTPVGDAVEFTSLNTLWGDARTRNQPCVIGSVKSNIGHLLTAAGAAALTKALWAIKDRTLPPTANFSKPGDTIALDESPFRILTDKKTWPAPSTHPRRAGVSAFGFGGINAHLLVEEPDDQSVSNAGSLPEQLELSTKKPSCIAVVGMATQQGDRLSQGPLPPISLALEPTSPSPFHWGTDGTEPGLYLEKVKIRKGKFRIPPRELQEMLPQQAVMLNTAASALTDCHTEAPSNQETGVFVGIAFDMASTGYHLRWAIPAVADQWARALSIDPHSPELPALVEQWQQQAHPPLTANRVMGSLGNIVASRIAREFHFGGPSFTVSSEETSGLHALSAAVSALQRGEINQALACAVDLPGDPRSRETVPDRSTVIEGATAFVLKRLDDARAAGDKVYAIIEDDQWSCSPTLATDKLPSGRSSLHFLPAVAPLESPPFYAGALTGLFEAARAISALTQRQLPVGTGAYWLADQAALPRRCQIKTGSVDGNVGLFTFRQSLNAPVQRPSPSRWPAALFLLKADTPAELIGLIASLRTMAGDSSNAPIERLASMWAEVSSSDREKPLCLSAVADSIEQLNRQLHLAQRHLKETPTIPLGEKGVLLPDFARDTLFYRPEPLSRSGKLAFVYPGMGNPYPSMGQQLMGLFPAVMDRQQQENKTLGQQYQTQLLWQHEIDRNQQNGLVMGQVAMGTAITDILCACGIQPTAAIGYSLGEATALFALRAWNDRDGMMERLQQSPLFTTELAGPCHAAQRHWQQDESEPVQWRLGVIDRPADEVHRVLSDLPRVYLLIINTPSECVIGGDAEQLQQALDQLSGNFFELEGVSTVHCPVVHEVATAYRNLHRFETTPPVDCTFYSGAYGSSYPLSQEASANAILKQAVQTVDFTRVISQAYEDGVRLFVEIGPGNSCSRMVQTILADRPHMSRSACWSGQPESVSFLRLIAELAAEGVPVQPTFIGPAPEAQTDKAPSLVIERLAQTLPQIELPPTVRPARPEPAPPRSSQPEPPQTKHTLPVHSELKVEDSLTATIALTTVQQTNDAVNRAHGQFLDVMQNLQAGMAQQVELQQRLLQKAFNGQTLPGRDRSEPMEPQTGSNMAPPPKEVLFDRAMCMEFAIGSVAKMLGPEFEEVDRYPTRVRLPDAPLQLVDRILSIEGQPRSMKSGRVVTEHDVKPDSWYLDAGRAPTCISVEAGQADLFLSGYLGIDFQHKGRAVYRLLDAEVTFHRDLPRAGEVIRYDIHIDRFFRQNDTWLFNFWFDGTIDGAPFISMRKGCAGFFTEQELEAGKGIVHTALDLRPQSPIVDPDYVPLLPLEEASYSDAQLEALRAGDLATCFGPAFEGLPIEKPLTFPGGRMKLVDRILELNPTGGRFGLGQIRGEADIHPEDWFLTCHFCDDHVMPGTLMYECCQHTLRILLLRMGWVAETDHAVWQPVLDRSNQLKCRGQVTETTKKVEYRITLKELGFNPAPFAIADALMLADGKPIVEVLNLSVMLTGTDQTRLKQLWGKNTSFSTSSAKPALFDTDKITAYAIGKPSEAFGEPYKVFDQQRKIARLPGPPFQFLDRITAIETEPWVMQSGGRIEAQYDVPLDAWYFGANQQHEMPFCVLLETALQPCGWMAAYVGSALTSDQDLSFRNLDGRAVQYRAVTANSGTLTTQVTMTRVAQSGGMIIQSYDFTLSDQHGPVYQGDTVFGFFTATALKQQVGLRDENPWQPSEEQVAQSASFPYPAHAPFPQPKLRMIDQIDLYLPHGGPHQRGYIRGSMQVDPDRWFFKAHFYQDPVIPGSLGLESMLQLLKVVADQRWATNTGSTFETLVRDVEHQWCYRGQVIPTNATVQVEAVVTQIDDEEQCITADGSLYVDGKNIYKMVNFTLKLK